MNLQDLTVVVPTRNEAHNIRALLHSLPASLSLIVVDASDDETPNIITTLRPAHTIVIQHPGTVTEARQIGAMAARTPWLLFTDADVIFAADYFDRLPAHSHADLIYGPKLSTDAFIRYYRWFTRGQRLLHFLGFPAASGSNLLVSRQAFLAVGGFDLRLTCNEDTELSWRVKRAGYRVTFANDLIVYARDHRRLHTRYGVENTALFHALRGPLLAPDPRSLAR